MSIRNRSSTWCLLAALSVVFAACTGEPTGLGDPAEAGGNLELPGTRSGDDGGTAGSDGSGESTGSSGSEDAGGSEGDSDDVDEPLHPVGEAASGYARIAVTQSGEFASALLADAASQIQASVASGKLAGVSVEQIQAIHFTLTGVQLHRLGSPDEQPTDGEAQAGSTDAGGDGSTEDGESSSGVSGASWVTVELAEGTTLDINLIELPPETIEADASSNSAGLEIAAGGLPAGTYKNVRLLGEATITFTEDLAAENADFVAGEAYPLDIPSSASSGVKVQTPKFDIEDGATATVMIVFDGPASIKKIKLQPGGAKMVPVMKADVEVGTAAAPESPAP